MVKNSHQNHDKIGKQAFKMNGLALLIILTTVCRKAPSTLGLSINISIFQSTNLACIMML